MADTPATELSAPEPTAFERAARKIQVLGLEAQLLYDEAAAVLDVSVPHFYNLDIPSVQWSARGRRWRYGTIVERAKELEKRG